MREQELRAAATCAVCHQLIGHSGAQVFAQVSVQFYRVDLEAVKRQTGLAMLLQSAGLAAVMGPDEELATPINTERPVTVCFDCCGHPTSLYQLAAAVREAE